MPLSAVKTQDFCHFLGLYDFRDAENTDGIAEASHKKKRNLLYNTEFVKFLVIK